MAFAMDITTETTWEVLKEKVKGKVGAGVLNVVLTYVDSDQDTISIVTENDFIEAVVYMKEECLSSLKVSVKLKNEHELQLKQVSDVVDDSSVPGTIREGFAISAENASVDIDNDVVVDSQDEDNLKNLVHTNFVCDGCHMYPITGSRFRSAVNGNVDYCSACVKQHPEMAPYDRITKSLSIHYSVICDGCEKTPIEGTRFKSYFVPNFDLCSQCEASGNFRDTHEPFIKINDPVLFQRAQRRCLRSSASSVHFGVTCDGCNAHPIVGVRYKSTSVVNFDLCETCEACEKYLLSHGPFLKIPFPTLASIIPRLNIPFGCASNDDHKPQEIRHERRRLRFQCHENRENRLKAKFVSDESFADGSVCSPGQIFVKCWRLQNNGECDWPSNCSAQFVTGAKLHADNTPILVPALKKGEEFVLEVQMIAPSDVGRYVSYWRLFNPDQKRFGNRFWIDIAVEEMTVLGQDYGNDNESVDSLVIIDNVDENVSDENKNDIESVAEAVQGIRISDPSTVHETKTETLLPDAEKYLREAQEKSMEKVYKKELELLASMGFYDVELNRSILDYCYGDVTTVVAHLLQK